MSDRQYINCYAFLALPRDSRTPARFAQRAQFLTEAIKQYVSFNQINLAEHLNIPKVFDEIVSGVRKYSDESHMYIVFYNVLFRLGFQVILQPLKKKFKISKFN